MMRSDWVEMDVLKLINQRARRVAATVGAGAVTAASGESNCCEPAANNGSENRNVKAVVTANANVPDRRLKVEVRIFIS